MNLCWPQRWFLPVIHGVLARIFQTNIHRGWIVTIPGGYGLGDHGIDDDGGKEGAGGIEEGMRRRWDPGKH